MPEEQLRTVLKLAGYNMTSPRRAVFAALQRHGPQTIRQVIVACQQADRASIYRTLALFEMLGIVHRLQIGWKYKLELTDTFVRHHHHASCTNCGIVIPLPEDPVLERRLHVLTQSHHFAAQDHQLEIRGLCVNCSGVQDQDVV